MQCFGKKKKNTPKTSVESKSTNVLVSHSTGPGITITSKTTRLTTQTSTSSVSKVESSEHTTNFNGSGVNSFAIPTRTTSTLTTPSTPLSSPSYLRPFSTRNIFEPSSFGSSGDLDAIPYNASNRFHRYSARSAFFSDPLTSNHSTTKLSVRDGPSREEFGSAYLNKLDKKLTIKVVKTGKLYDDPKNTKIPTYSTHSSKRGKLLLINNIKFANAHKIRQGAALDEENLLDLFKQIGFGTDKYRDLTKKEMEKKIVSFRSDSSLSKVDIGVIIVMSHGTGNEKSDSTEVSCTDGKLLETQWIINQFDNENCPGLSRKPKIFIFQCCRGDQVDIQYDAIPAKPSSSSEIRKLSDMLIAYSTIPGFVAHRDPLHGSWYIQAICQIFMEHAHDTDVENLLKMVDSNLSKLISPYNSKQTSSFENRGFKTCYLHPCT